MSNKKHRKQQGFTLMELLIVMAILGMLAAVVVPGLYKQLFGAQRDAAATQIANMDSIIGQYLLDMRKYPSNLEELVENRSNSKAWNGPYLKPSQLKDPWGNVFQYRRPGRNGRDYDLYSYASDGTEGGEGDGADIGNWE
ncbi:General secretion pathway protein G [Beggiatoa sp. PS]|nr:General secretion pathway protein G [Beggiatoa sp. PS]